MLYTFSEEQKGLQLAGSVFKQKTKYRTQKSKENKKENYFLIKKTMNCIKCNKIYLLN